MKTIILFFAFIFLSNCAWVQFGTYLNNNDPVNMANEINSDWQHNFPPNAGVTYNCAGQQLAGGYCISSFHYLRRQLIGLPSHTKIKLQFLWYAIDTWDYQTQGDKFLVKTDNVVQHSFTANDASWTHGNFCGNPDIPDYRDSFKRIEVDFPHTATNTLLEFTAQSFEGPCNEAWGIYAVTVYTDECEQGQILIGGDCINQDFAYDCFKKLFQIRDPTSPRPGIQHKCEAVIDDEGNISYNLAVSYSNPYQHDPDCFTHAIFVEQTHLNTDPLLDNNWTFNIGSQTFNFNIDHDNLVNYYGCDFSIDPVTGLMEWVCDIYLYIYFQGQQDPVFTYHFKLCITADSKLVNTGDFIVLIEIYQEDDCCDVKIQAHSELNFCNDILCQSYSAQDPHIAYWQNTGTVVIVEQRVLEASFANYYLNLDYILVNGVAPTILYSNNNIQGKLIVQFSGPYFLGTYNVEMVSHLSDVDNMIRRLEEGEEDEQTETKYVKDIRTIEIVGGDGQYSQGEETQTIYVQKQEEESSPVWPIVGGVAIFLVLTVLFANLGCYIKKQKAKAQKSAQYERKDSTSSERDSIKVTTE